MKDKLKELFSTWEMWAIISLPLAALILFAAVFHASINFKPPEKVTHTPTESEVTFDMEENKTFTSDDGLVVIDTLTDESNTLEIPVVRNTTPEKAWENTSPSSHNYTLPQDTILKDGSIGSIFIPKIKLSAPVFETDEENSEIEAMTKGIAHFAVTSAWDGNIGLCSHNVPPAGAVAYFKDLHKLNEGDEITYKTSLGTRKYKVNCIKEIEQDDWSYLIRYDDSINRLTMITCITGKPDMRLMVQASETV